MYRGFLGICICVLRSTVSSHFIFGGLISYLWSPYLSPFFIWEHKGYNKLLFIWDALRQSLCMPNECTFTGRSLWPTTFYPKMCLPIHQYCRGLSSGVWVERRGNLGWLVVLFASHSSVWLSLGGRWRGSVYVASCRRSWRPRSVDSAPSSRKALARCPPLRLSETDCNASWTNPRRRCTLSGASTRCDRNRNTDFNTLAMLRTILLAHAFSIALLQAEALAIVTMNLRATASI